MPTPAATPVPESLAASDDLLAFVSVARLAAGAATVADVLALSTGLIRSIVPDASGVWFLLSPAGDRLVADEAFGKAEAVLRTVTIRLGERLSGWVAANRQVIRNSDPALDLGELATTMRPSLKSCLCVPLMSGETLVGVLTLYASEQAAFSEDQGRLMQMIAPQVAQAIELARRAADEPQIRTTRDLRLVSTH
jgi:GAF domain-containing protein